MIVVTVLSQIRQSEFFGIKLTNNSGIQSKARECEVPFGAPQSRISEFVKFGLGCSNLMCWFLITFQYVLLDAISISCF